ncbi:MAG: 7-cyano-7-deazaguanine synthase QueC [Thermoprotei archaeon]
MCSISGCILFDAQRDEKNLEAVEEKLRNIVLRAEERGRDSYGFVSISKTGDVKTIKQVGKPSESLWRQPRIIEKDTVIVLSNNRAEPTTEYVRQKRDNDIQPFVSHGFVVAHNGTVANDKELEREFGLTRDTPIDSAIIPPLLSKLWDGSLRGLRPILSEVLIGSFALALVDLSRPSRLFLAANYKPLYLEYDSQLDVVFFSSFDYYMQPENRPIWLQPPIRQVEPYSAMMIDSSRNHEEVDLWRESIGRRVLVVCSSGLDSTTAAVYMIKQGYDVTLLHFRYRHRAEKREYECVKQVAARLKVPLIVVDTDVFREYMSTSPLLDQNMDISTKNMGESGAEFAHEWVPARNLIFLSIATGIAESQGYDYVVLGNNLEEAGAYSDNEMMFVRKLNELLPYATNLQRHVRILMPVGNLMKHEIVRLALKLGAPLESTWSCYNGGEKHCGKCGPCYMRRKAFEIVGANDPVEYLQ